MDLDEQNKYIIQLESENKKLRDQFDREKEFKKEVSKTGYWVFEKIGLLVVGKDLKKSTNALIDEFNEKKTISKDTVVDLSISIFKRLTRTRVLTVIIFLITIISPIILIQQNRLIGIQNTKIDEQTSLFELQNSLIKQQSFLAEASRRSSQMLVLGDILRDVNTELNDLKNTKDTLSAPLVARIVSLSLVLKPYKYFENGEIIEKPLSPERGQLLISLATSGINNSFLIKKILKDCDFSYSDLNNAKLFGVDLSGVNLMNSSFTDVEFNAVKLENSNLSGSYFEESRFNGCNFIRANLSYSTILTSKFIQSDLNTTNLIDSKIFKTTFYSSKLKGVDFERSVLNNIDFTESILGTTTRVIGEGRTRVTVNISTNFEKALYIDSLFVDKSNWLENHQYNLKLEGLEVLDTIKAIPLEDYLKFYDYSTISFKPFLIENKNKIKWFYDKESKAWLPFYQK